MPAIETNTAPSLLRRSLLVSIVGPYVSRSFPGNAQNYINLSILQSTPISSCLRSCKRSSPWPSLNDTLICTLKTLDPIQTPNFWSTAQVPPSNCQVQTQGQQKPYSPRGETLEMMPALRNTRPRARGWVDVNRG